VLQRFIFELGVRIKRQRGEARQRNENHKPEHTVTQVERKKDGEIKSQQTDLCAYVKKTWAKETGRRTAGLPTYIASHCPLFQAY
jgi:hypothetical protein